MIHVVRNEEKEPANSRLSIVVLCHCFLLVLNDDRAKRKQQEEQQQYMRHEVCIK
jgi:hypothetical protein